MVFGKKKKETKKEATPETPDLVVPVQPQPVVQQPVAQPQHMGMPGFVPDQPQPVVQQPVPQPQPVVYQQPIAPIVQPTTPPPALQPRDWFKVQAAEEIGDGLYRYVLVTNKNLGEIGGTYEV